MEKETEKMEKEMEDPEKKVYRPLCEYGSPTKWFPCRVCADLPEKVRPHRHHSTKYFHTTLLERGETEVDCPFCKKIHPIIDESEERLTIIFSTSTIHNAMFNESVHPKGHINIETIAGATTDLLRANFSLLYWKEKKPMTVIVSSGLNDMDTDIDVFLQTVYLFKKNVLDQNPLNRFYMVKMLRPPKYAWFPATREPMPVYTSAGGHQKYVNHIDKIDRINATFDKLNKPNNFPTTVGFHLMGLTIHTKTNAAGEKYKQYRHDLPKWREYDEKGAAQCLHLIEPLRATMLNKLINFVDYIGKNKY